MHRVALSGIYLCLLVLSSCSRNEPVTVSRSESIPTGAPLSELQHGQSGDDANSSHSLEHHGESAHPSVNANLVKHNQHSGDTVPDNHAHRPRVRRHNDTPVDGHGRAHKAVQQHNPAASPNAVVDTSDAKGPADSGERAESVGNLSAAEVFERRILPILQSD